MNKVSNSKAQGILGTITSKAKDLKPRFLIYGREGVGKTSFPAFMKNPVYLMSQGETGLETLVSNNQIKEVPHFPEFTDWNTFTQAVKALITEPHDYQTIVFDCLDGFESLLFKSVCAAQFGGNPKKFNHYREGQRTAMPQFEAFLNDLDKLRRERDCTIVFLAHARVVTRTNPLGVDVTMYEPNLDKDVMALAKGWADMMLFMNFVSAVDEDGKGTGGGQRICYCNPADSYDAKSRIKLPDAFSLGATAEDGYNEFKRLYAEGKKNNA